MRDMPTHSRATLIRLVSAMVAVASVMGSAPAHAQDDFRVADRMMIEDVAARYVFTLDSSDIDGYASLFTEDATLNVNNIDIIKGRDAIHSAMQRMAAMMSAQTESSTEPGTKSEFGPMRHVVTSQTIDFEGDDKAVSQAFWMEIMSNGPSVPPSIFNMGRYEDVFVKRNGKWLIQYRLAIADMGYVPNLEGIMPPPEQK